MEMLKWTIGNATITQITETEAGAVLQQLMTSITPKALAQMPALQPHFLDGDGNMKGWFQSFIIEVGDKTYFIEGGIGNERERPHFPGMHNLKTNFLEQIKEAGFALTDIDYVIASHLHIDHVGWFTQLVDDQWQPTFPNARYIIVQSEYDFWKDREANPDQMAAIRECVVPVVEADVVDFVAGDAKLNEHISLVPAPGHTPSHVAIQLDTDSQRVLFSGDVFPHPSVIFDNELQFGSDADPEQAVQTRRTMLKSLADTDTIMLSPHFANPVAVKIKTSEAGYTFELA
ncbi:MAG: MBL fold metallo-hydrolase [Chloroflexota bacterium]